MPRQSNFRRIKNRKAQCIKRHSTTNQKLIFRSVTSLIIISWIESPQNVHGDQARADPLVTVVIKIIIDTNTLFMALGECMATQDQAAKKDTIVDIKGEIVGKNQAQVADLFQPLEFRA